MQHCLTSNKMRVFCFGEDITEELQMHTKLLPDLSCSICAANTLDVFLGLNCAGDAMGISTA
jgi:hypothetical protein